jgi:carbon storage regulator
MLVITRRPGHSVRLGQDIEVVVLRVDGAEIRIGIKAPREIPVLRRELLSRVESEAACRSVTGSAVQAALENLGAARLADEAGV